MSGLTPRQQDALRFIIGFQESHGFCPSFREIGSTIGVSSPSRVSKLLDELEDRGAIRRLFKRTRAIEVLRPIAIPRAPDGEPLHVVHIGGRG